MVNTAADQVATDTFAEHPSFDEGKLDLAKKRYYMAKNICKLAALAVPAWQRSTESGKLQLREDILVARSRHRRQREQRRQHLEPVLLSPDGGHFWLDYGTKGFR